MPSQPSVFKHERTIVFEHCIEHEPTSWLANEPRQQLPSRREWLKSQIPAIELYEIKKLTGAMDSTSCSSCSL